MIKLEIKMKNPGLTTQSRTASHFVDGFGFILRKFPR